VVRQPDSEIPLPEPLYRSVCSEDVVGMDVLAAAVDLPRCSFNRSRFSRPEDVIVAGRPADNGIVQITSADLPAPVPRESPSIGVAYKFDAFDDPTAENDAHAEIRMYLQDGSFNKNHKPHKPTLAKAKDALARKLTILRSPSED